MTIRFSENRLGLIGAGSTRWPDPSISLFWKSAHECIAVLVALARTTDQEIDLVETNRDLSEVGRLKVTGDTALKAVNSLADFAPLKRMEERGAADISMFTKKKGMLPQGGAEAASPVVAAQIRDRIAGHASPGSFVLKHKADPAVVAAVREAPAFISGLKPEEKATFLREAEAVLWPDATNRIAQIEKALDLARRTVSQVEKMIAERAQLLQTLGTDGNYRWELKPGARAA